MSNQNGNQNEDVLLLIVPPVEVVEGETDRGGGDTHAGVIKRLLGMEKPIDMDTARASLEQAVRQVRTLLEDLKRESIEGWELDSLSVSLAVSVEGSIGIATGGLEGSFELSYKRSRPPASTGQPS